jgi:hypothetical protein
MKRWTGGPVTARYQGLAGTRLCGENIDRPDQIDLVESDRIACAVVELRPLRLYWAVIPWAFPCHA